MFAFDLDDFELIPTAPGLRVSFPLHSATGTASTATVLFEQDFGRDLVVPLWAVTWAPPAFYLVLALVALRHTPAGRRLGWAVAACGVNACLGLTTALALSFAHPMSFAGAFIRALWTYAPAPAIHLVIAPLVSDSAAATVRPAAFARRATSAASSSNSSAGSCMRLPSRGVIQSRVALRCDAPANAAMAAWASGVSKALAIVRASSSSASWNGRSSPERTSRFA